MKRNFLLLVVLMILCPLILMGATKFYEAKLGAGQAVWQYPREVVAYTTSHTLTRDESLGGTIIEVGGNATITANGAVHVGDHFCIKTVGAYKVLFKPYTSDIINILDGTALTAGYSIKNNSTGGDFVCLYGSATAGHWRILSASPAGTTWATNGS